MSVSGNIAMSLLRLFHLGKGSFQDVEKSRRRAAKENERGRFIMPRDKRALYELVQGTEYPCLILRSRRRETVSEEKAVLFLYGGATSSWKIQLGIAIDYANRTGLPVWYPIYPSITEVNITKSIDVLYGVYRRMTERYASEKIAVVGLSFGGTFAMELVNWNNRSPEPVGMPGLIIAHSPGGTPDTEEDWAEMKQYEKRDPFFTLRDVQVMIELTAHGQETPPHALTPIHEDFHNAPPTYMYYGEEILAGNAPAYRRAFQRDGVGDRLHIEIVKNMMHGYSCIPVFPESKKSYFEGLALIERL